MNAKEKLLIELEKFGYPVKLQGSILPDEPYPDSFITYFTDDTEDGDHFDNETESYVWYFAVIFYSNDPALVNSKPEEIRKSLKQAGFIPQGKGQDALSDEPTHTGWAQDYFYIEY